MRTADAAPSALCSQNEKGHLVGHVKVSRLRRPAAVHLAPCPTGSEGAGHAGTHSPTVTNNGHKHPALTPQEVVDPASFKDTTRLYMTRKAQPWHVDASDMVSLLFLKTAKSGGLRCV